MTGTPRRLGDFKGRNLEEEKSAKGVERELGLDKVTGHPDTMRSTKGQEGSQTSLRGCQGQVYKETSGFGHKEMSKSSILTVPVPAHYEGLPSPCRVS